jgi:hypothetical protein
MTRLRCVPFLCGLGWALAMVVGGGGGCGRDPATAETSTIQFRLDFGSGVTLSSVDYALTGPNNFLRVGALPVGDTSIVTATFQDLPTGRGYKIQVAGTASDQTSSCAGELTFAVTASMTATLQIPLSCTGLAAVSATFNVCPVIDSLSAIPAEVRVGASIDLTAEVHDTDAGPAPLSATWTASGGMVSNPSAAGARFTCTGAGTFTVGLSVSDGDVTSRCPATSALTLTCTPA